MSNQTKIDSGSVLRSVSKPGRYIGEEFNRVVKEKGNISLRFALCFPDTYEIGMSNLGTRILYDALNRESDIWCERAYAPWLDMDERMEQYGLPLTALESGDPLADFDIIGFSLQYELCYSTALRMLMLANLPLRSADRDSDDFPIILGGGPCAYNPEPVADFFDIFSIGEGEEALVELSRLYIRMKREGRYSKRAFLHEAARLEGFYVPAFYEVRYREDGTIEGYFPKYDDIPTRVRKRIVADMDRAVYPEKLVMPYIETVHDRIVLEVYRGCIRGCRFCQAGMVYRPIREKSPETLCRQAKCLYENSGYEEISLISLSISDYSRLGELTDSLLQWTDDAHVSLSLPSLRIDSFSEELMKKTTTVRSGGVTFAPEAGTQRLRDTINKNVTEEDLMRSVGIAFAGGRNSVKLYFMSGLPTETDEDIEGIADLAKKVVHRFYQTPERNKGKSVSVTISVSCFIPKPFTPFQWEAQMPMEELERRQELLRSCITDRKIRYTHHDARVSRLEAVFARGDRRLSTAIETAVREGTKFDAWDECFDYDHWMDVLNRCGIDPGFYANREFGEEECLPWDIIDCGVTKEYLLRERHRAYRAETTPSCAEHCNGCGANHLGGKNRWCR